jgi:hypothetical protein
MKRCPKCNKQYDDTWEVCLGCSVKLQDTGSIEGVVQKCVDEVKNEINDIRSNMDVLQKRINILERGLTRESLMEKIGQQRSSAAEEIEDMPVQTQGITGKDYSLFKEEKPAPRKQRQNEPKPTYLFKEEKKKVSLSQNFEQMLGEKWFNKLGILAVVIGVVLLVGYSFRFFGAFGKLSIGYAFGLGLLSYGSFVERKENLSNFGKSLIAGGWAINYFTTFAMHHIPDVRLVQSPVIGMFLLIVVSAASIMHIYRYKSQLATSFSYLLMFITLMVTPISLYTVYAGLLVASSLIFFMYRLRWNSFALYGLVMSYLSYMTFLGRSPKVEIEIGHFIAVTAVLAIYWTIFSIAGLLMKDEESTDYFSKKALTFILNSGGASLCGALLISNGFEKYTLNLILIGIVAHLLWTAGTYVFDKRRECLINSTFTIGFCLLYASFRFSGYPLTVAYIIIAQIVLLAGIALKESYWRQLASVLLVVVFAKIVFVDSYIANFMATTAIHPSNILFNLNSRTLLFAGTFIMFLGNYHLYSHIKKKDMLSDNEKQWNILFSYFYPAIFAMGTWLDLPKVLTAPAWAILGVILLQIGISKNDEHKRIQGYILTIGAFSRLFLSNFTLSGAVGIISYRLLTVIPVLCIIYYCQLILKEQKRNNRSTESESMMPIFYTYMVFAGLMFLIRYEMPGVMVAPMWGLVSLGYVIKGVTSKEKYYMNICAIGAIATSVRVIYFNIMQPQYVAGVYLNMAYPILTAGLLYAANLIYTIRPVAGDDNVEDEALKKSIKSTQFVYALAATSAVTVLIIAKTSGVALTTCLAVEGLLLFLSGFIIKEKNWRFFGLLVLLATLGKVFLVDLRQLETIYYILSLIILGGLLLFVSYIYSKYKDRIGKIM